MDMSDMTAIQNIIQTNIGTSYAAAQGPLTDILTQVPFVLSQKLEDGIPDISGGEKYIPYDRFMSKISALDSRSFVTSFVYNTNEIYATANGINNMYLQFGTNTDDLLVNSNMREQGMMWLGLTLFLIWIIVFCYLLKDLWGKAEVEKEIEPVVAPPPTTGGADCTPFINALVGVGDAILSSGPQTGGGGVTKETYEKIKAVVEKDIIDKDLQTDLLGLIDGLEKDQTTIPHGQKTNISENFTNFLKQMYTSKSLLDVLKYFKQAILLLIPYMPVIIDALKGDDLINFTKIYTIIENKKTTEDEVKELFTNFDAKFRTITDNLLKDQPNPSKGVPFKTLTENLNHILPIIGFKLGFKIPFFGESPVKSFITTLIDALRKLDLNKVANFVNGDYDKQLNIFKDLILSKVEENMNTTVKQINEITTNVKQHVKKLKPSSKQENAKTEKKISLAHISTFCANMTIITAVMLVFFFLVLNTHIKKTARDKYNLQTMQNNAQSMVQNATNCINIFYTDVITNDYYGIKKPLPATNPYIGNNIIFDKYTFNSSQEPATHMAFNTIAGGSTIDSTIKIQINSAASLDTVYTSLIDILESYNTCNAIFALKSEKAPFPIVEISLYVIVLVVSLVVLALVWINLKPMCLARTFLNGTYIDTTNDKYGTAYFLGDCETLDDETKDPKEKLFMSQEMETGFKFLGSAIIIVIVALFIWQLQTNASLFPSSLFSTTSVPTCSVL
jgi:hypothetical protein